MAADREYAVEGFGQVSKRLGVAFRLLLFAATTIGILSLLVLMVFVAIDAFQPFSADPGWYALYLAVLVVPTAIVGGVLHRRSPATGLVGLQTLGVAVAGAMVGAGISVLFIEVVAINAFFAYSLALGITVGSVIFYRRIRADARAVELLVVAVATGLTTLVALPPAIRSVPVLPAEWLLVVITPVAPVAAGAAWLVGGWYGRRAAILAGGGTLAIAVAGGLASLALGTGAPTGVLLSVAVLVPLGVYVGRLWTERPGRLVGLAVPIVLIGGLLAGRVISDALGVAGPPSWFDWQFLTSPHSNIPTDAGVYPALVGSVMLMVLVVVLSFPIGVGAAVYLEEYAGKTWFTRMIQVNIANLAGVPSVVYGLLALGVFINLGGLGTGSLLVAGMALSLLILPIVIISAQEAIRAVPDSMRQASYGMGATRYQTVRHVVLPRALPGILTGTILALGRALGETAPLIMIGAPAVGSVPDGFNSKVVALPMQVFTWASTFASPEFFTTALAAGVVTLLVVLLMMNSIAIVLRNKYERGT